VYGFHIEKFVYVEKVRIFSKKKSYMNLTNSIKGEDKKTAWKPTSQAVE
jgi:hypothetical protein